MLKRTAVIVISVVLFIILFLAVQRLVVPKYASDVLEGNFTAEYYDETIEHDVIMIGDCEVYESYDPVYMWKNFGITCYIRGNAQQLTWQSYYMLEDTLKYETPKAVIYNVQALTHEKPQREEYNRMTLDGMNWSSTKINAIRASMCKGEKVSDYIFPILRYHSRITELSGDDFKYFFNSRKITHNGYYMRIDTLPLSQSEAVDGSWLLDRIKQEEYENEESEEEEISGEETDDIIDPWAQVEEAEEGLNQDGGVVQADISKVHTVGEDFGEYPMHYLDEIRKLCEEKGIKLILVKAPSLSPQWYDTDNEQVVEYADKYNIPYINFYELMDETGIDFETDTYDGGFHVNIYGADKLSEYLGKELREKYGIPDRREDEKISAVYEEKEAFYEKMIEEQKAELKEYGKIINY